MFLKIIGILIGLAFFYVGLRLALYPKRFIQAMQNYKYKSTSEPQKNAIVLTRIIGIVIMLIGVYYTTFAILAIIYPA